MFSHLDAIGLTADEFEAQFDAIIDLATEEATTAGSRHLRWLDTSGASMAFHVVGDKIACITPFFDPWVGLSRWQVTTSEAHDNDECAHCGGADCDLLVDGEMVTRATIQWLHFLPCRDWLAQERTYDLEVVAFAEQLEIHADEEAFRRNATTATSGLKLSPEAFIPLGMFGEEAGGSAPRALLAGRVTSAALLHNPFGGPFWHLRLESLPGPVDVVAPAHALEAQPKAGAIALVEAWLVGRPVSGPM